MRRVYVYVDGFNFYHAIDDIGEDSLKWVNLWALSESIISPNETLYAVKYFSAYATWHPSGYARHRHYIAALEAESVTVIMGSFKEKWIECRLCKKTFKTHEEKETDVNIGIHLVADALNDKFDRALVISADSDLRVAVDLAKQMAPNKAINVAAPSGRFSFARDLNPLFSITKGRVRASRLEDQYVDGDGSVIAEVPEKYRI